MMGLEAWEVVGLEAGAAGSEVDISRCQIRDTRLSRNKFIGAITWM